MRLEPFTPARLLTMAVEHMEHAKSAEPLERYKIRREAEKALQAACWMERQGHVALPCIGPFTNWLPEKGDTVWIGAGADIRSTSNRLRRVNKRRYKVKVHSVTPGAIFHDRDDGLTIRMAEVTWAGSGGYWCWTTIQNIAPVHEGEAA